MTPARPFRRTTSCFALLLLLAGGRHASAQPPAPPSALPSIPSTSAAPPAAPAPTAPAPALPLNAAKRPPGRAQVNYTAGLLEVVADNSSLNQILREIARQTGMTITGGVTDERVFGSYGPAPTSEVLATLLDGGGVNMLLRETPSKAPLELVLTPRDGRPTPPSPDAPIYNYNDARAAEPLPSAPHWEVPGGQSSPYGTPSPETRPGIAPQSFGPGPSPYPNTATPADPAAQSSTPPGSSSLAPSPNAIKTPQQIYQQLQQLQQQQQQANPK